MWFEIAELGLRNKLHFFLMKVKSNVIHGTSRWNKKKTQVLTYMGDRWGEAQMPSCLSANTPVDRGSGATFSLNEQHWDTRVLIFPCRHFIQLQDDFFRCVHKVKNILTLVFGAFMLSMQKHIKIYRDLSTVTMLVSLGVQQRCYSAEGHNVIKLIHWKYCTDPTYISSSTMWHAAELCENKLINFYSPGILYVFTYSLRCDQGDDLWGMGVIKSASDTLI